MSFLKELWQFMKVRKKFWMLPIFIVFFFFSLLLLAQSSAIAPFIYTLF